MRKGWPVPAAAVAPVAMEPADFVLLLDSFFLDMQIQYTFLDQNCVFEI
jgi:hypothetical protein